MKTPVSSFFNDNFQVRDVQESPFIIRPLLFTNSALGRWQIADTTIEVACAPLTFARALFKGLCQLVFANTLTTGEQDAIYFQKSDGISVDHVVVSPVLGNWDLGDQGSR